MADGVSLRIPEGLGVRFASNDADREAVHAFVARSPERTVYHSDAYLDFARRENGAADLALLTRDGNPLFALPVHPAGATINTGYSGVLLPATSKESALAKAVSGLGALCALNSLECLQSAQAPAYDDPKRITLVERLLDDQPVARRRFYSRLVDIAPGAAPDGAGMLDTEALVAQGMESYESATRAQVRQGARHGIEVTVVDACDPVAREAAYREYLPVHVESWTRTGATPHTLDYWLGLSAAVCDGGGRDLVVLARREGRLLAAITCHVFGDRAIYWSAGSTPEGQETRANPLAMHAAMAACAAAGARTYELGRFRPDEPSEKERTVTRYKAQFGGYLVRLVMFGSPPPAHRRLATQVRRAAGRARRVRSVLRR
jgi:hypothetical protein